MQLFQDDRIVMTLDAGGTNFVFTAIQGMEEIVSPIQVSSEPDDLESSLDNIIEGLTQVRNRLQKDPVAISFAFPGPADYKRGIIGDLGNLPAYRGGVALGPMLEDRFEIPVFINNDGNLFAYGEAIGGFLPQVNAWLKQADNPKRYRNLLGVTLGTGIGAGIVSHGTLYQGDNSSAGEMWLMHHKGKSAWNVEEGASIRAVRRFYAEETRDAIQEMPTPKQIYEIAEGKAEGDQEAALQAYRKLGEVVGDALADAATLLDGLIVFGGGLSGAYHLFVTRMIEEMNAEYSSPDGQKFDRLVMDVYDLQKEEQLNEFIQGNARPIQVPRSNRTVQYDPEKRIGIGRTSLGTSKATAIGAYAIALNTIDE